MGTELSWRLLSACSQNHSSREVAYLLELGASPELRDANGRFALLAACDMGSVPNVRNLLSHGAGVNQESPNRCTPLMVATFRGYLEIVRILLTHSARVNVHNKVDGGFPLLYACHTGSPSILRLLVGSSTAEVNATSTAGWFPLLKAVSRGCAERVELLVTHKACVNQQTCLGQALTLACSKGFFEISRYLVTHGAHVNTRVDQAWVDPPLVAACYGGHAHLVDYLIKEGADVHRKASTCVEACALGNHLTTAELLFRRGIGGAEWPKYPRFSVRVEQLHRERATLFRYIQALVAPVVAEIVLSFHY